MSFNPAHLNVRFAGFGFGIDEHTTVTGSFAQSVGDGFGGRVDVVLPGVPLANNLAAVEAACVPKTRGNAGGGGVKTLVFDQDPFFWLGFPF
jgi:hypothetical protein